MAGSGVNTNAVNSDAQENNGGSKAGELQQLQAVADIEAERRKAAVEQKAREESERKQNEITNKTSEVNSVGQQYVAAQQATRQAEADVSNAYSEYMSARNKVVNALGTKREKSLRQKSNSP